MEQFEKYRRIERSEETSEELPPPDETSMKKNQVEEMEASARESSAHEDNGGSCFSKKMKTPEHGSTQLYVQPTDGSVVKQ